jgi:hypothetical protein
MSTEPVGLRPGHVGHRRSESGTRRRLPALAAAVIVALAGAAAGGYFAGHGHPRAVVHTVTRIERVTTVKTVTRWRSRTRSATSGASTTPCIEQNGTVVPAVGSAAAGSPGLTTCSVQIVPDVPADAGDRLVITAPSGASSSFQLTSPSG